MLNSRENLEKMSLLELAEQAEPYDQSSKEKFLEVIRENLKELNKDYQKSSHKEEFLQKIRETGKVYFVLNQESYKDKLKLQKHPNVRVYVAFQEKVANISLYI